jgi:hypothetical protein
LTIVTKNSRKSFVQIPLLTIEFAFSSDPAPNGLLIAGLGTREDGFHMIHMNAPTMNIMIIARTGLIGWTWCTFNASGKETERV